MLKRSEQKIIEEMLESDDELPSDYEEIPDIPAYQNNSRFDPIQFNWIDSNFSQYYVRQNKNKVFLANLYSTFNEDIVHKKTENLKMGEKAMILQGVLNQQDIYCLKSVEPLASDTTLLWFINFLLYKDLQANFSFLKACLVDADSQKDSLKNDLYSFECKKYNFDFTTKK